MMLRAGLVAQLTANGGGDAIDTYVAGKIFFGDAPPDLTQIPCVTYAFVGGSARPTLSTSGVLRQRIEFNGLAVNPDTVNNLQPGDIASAIRDALVKRLNGWQALLNDGTNVLSCDLLNPGTDFVTEQRVFRCMCEFYVLYTLPA